MGNLLNLSDSFLICEMEVVQIKLRVVLKPEQPSPGGRVESDGWAQPQCF